MPHHTARPPEGDAGPSRSAIAIIDPDAQLVEVAVTGRWDHPTWAQARSLLSECLDEQPVSILLDLGRLDDPHAQSAALWFTTAREARRLRPPVRMAACLPDDSALAVHMRRLAARHQLAIHPDMRQARTVLTARRPLTDEICIALQPRLQAATEAREAVGTACRRWDLHELYPRAVLVASELVANAVQHAGTAITLTITRLPTRRRPPYHRHPQLRVTVQDRRPDLPRVLVPSAVAPFECGLGLRVVDAAAEAWGAFPTRTGKLVWAMLRARPK
ncbi:hypothetical protein BC793_1137 [Actinoplanes xinjiangensis]|uniref:Histidine kinase/HSP90-like ATPase domain-containing protein n=2 Tax=Actinoplanes xinjiangensis TaxID=512350 RepID=A0A316F974_9ACTN|nr:hypothetical protein BC793_1137 [Actinoplanes xinjiangensis]GIF41642.1 hypothetical protein Axi01nite_59530 [Actinoplanes xinjiangensis]